MITITITITGVGVQRRDSFIPTLGYGVPLWVPVETFMSVRLSLHPYLYFFVWSSASIFGDQSTRPVIARSTCGRRPQVQIP